MANTNLTRDEFLSYIEGCKRNPFDIAVYHQAAPVFNFARANNHKNGTPPDSKFEWGWITGGKTGKSFLQVDMHYKGGSTYMFFVDRRTPNDNNQFAGACTYIAVRLLSAWYWEYFNVARASRSSDRL